MERPLQEAFHRHFMSQGFSVGQHYHLSLNTQEYYARKYTLPLQLSVAAAIHISWAGLVLS